MSTVRVREVKPSHPDFRTLVGHLDQYLAVTDGDEHAFYDQHNRSDTLDFALLLEVNGRPVGCGALRAKSRSRVEVKRMYVIESMRGQRLAAKLLSALEELARDKGFFETVLETGLRQTAAVRLYQREGYEKMPHRYPPYESMENSVCFRKHLGV